MTTATIVTIKTANYSLTFNNDILVSAKCLLTGRFVKRSIAAAEYELNQLAVKQLAKQASSKAIIEAVKVLSSASFKVSATVFFALVFIALIVSFFIATPAVLIGKIIACTLVCLMPMCVVVLCCKDFIDDAKKQLQGVIAL